MLNILSWSSTAWKNIIANFIIYKYTLYLWVLSRLLAFNDTKIITFFHVCLMNELKYVNAITHISHFMKKTNKLMA